MRALTSQRPVVTSSTSRSSRPVALWIAVRNIVSSRSTSSEKIVQAAIALADEDGLEAVSLRNVGAALTSGPVRLYRYVETKEELLELMVDAVYGEMVSAGRIRGDWRKALRAIAQRTPRAAKEHAWFIDLLGGRPHLGPNALAHLEASLAASSETPGFEDIDAVLQALATVNAYVIGAIRGEASELRAQLHSGKSKSECQAALGPYMQRVIATGRYPTIAKACATLPTHPSTSRSRGGSSSCSTGSNHGSPDEPRSPNTALAPARGFTLGLGPLLTPEA